MTIPKLLFNRKTVQKKRDYCAQTLAAEFLFEIAADRLVERIGDTKKHFSHALIMGSRDGTIGRALKRQGQNKIDTMVHTDLSAQMLKRAHRDGEGFFLALDEQAPPFKEESFDLILSFMNLHWINDPQSHLRRLHRLLRPNGLYLAAFFGGENLAILRHCLFQADAMLSSQAQMRVAPAITLSDGASLLQQAGFILPVADRETIPVQYKNLAGLFRDLRQMGETASALNRPDLRTPKALFSLADTLYRQEHEKEGRIEVIFEILLLHGWKKT